MNTAAPVYLIAAISGRALAASAGRGGHRVVVLDCFADRDTRAAAQECRAVVEPGALRLDRRALLAAADELAPGERSAGLVCGAGFEGRTRLLARLAVGRRLLGNSPAVIASVKDPARFFPLLDQVQIRHPEIRFTPPDDLSGWLRKQTGGAGGAQVRAADGTPVGRRGYFQRFERGRTLSVLFLADGRRATVLGFNEQWVATGRPAVPFLFGGAVNQVGLPAMLEAEVTGRLQELVAATGLVGLNGLDFILQDRAWLALEINPRPTATVELHDADYPGGLFDAHLRACAGELPPAAAPARAARALAVVIASAAGSVEPGFDFPEWCRDLPMPGTAFSAGDPVCTVHAEAGDAAHATALVRERQRDIGAALFPAAPSVP